MHSQVDVKLSFITVQVVPYLNNNMQKKIKNMEVVLSSGHGELFYCHHVKMTCSHFCHREEDQITYAALFISHQGLNVKR